MNRYDENYSAYFAAPNEDYPLGSAVDSTSEDNLDGTPYLAAFFNDVIGFMQAVVFNVGGKNASVSGTPETVRKSNVWEAIQKYVDDNDKAVKDALDADISDINAKIPAQASAQNQLADKNFVNSSIATNTAYFVGTFNSVAELNAYSGQKTNNDYAFVQTVDSAGNTIFKRYKWNGTAWLYEYELNNSSFTASQWAAVNSGATAQKINQIKQMTGATASAGGAAGFVPAPAAGDSNKFLAGDGTWKKLTNPAVDSAWPVGVTYTQYPQQAAPGDLFPGTTWQIINYSGAFFRAEGGNAAAFIEKSGDLIKQSEKLPDITGSITNTNDDKGEQTAFENGVSFAGAFVGSTLTDRKGFSNGGDIVSMLKKISFKASNSNSIYSGDHVTPENFTVRVWKRIA